MLRMIFVLSIGLFGCSKFESIEYYPQPTPPMPEIPVDQGTGSADIQAVADTVNEARVAQGQQPLGRGLSCQLFTVPTSVSGIAGASLTSLGSFTYWGDFNQPNETSLTGVNMMPQPVRSVLKQYYVMRCQGYLMVATSGWYNFELSSDDGAVLYIGGSALINNDGVHAVTTKTGMKFLSRGAHSFRLDYLDIGGSHALMLKSGGSIVPAEVFYF